MGVWALLSDRAPARVLPALDEVRPDLKLEALEAGSLDHVLDISPDVILVDAVENPGQAWSVLRVLAGRRGPRARDRRDGARGPRALPLARGRGRLLFPRRHRGGAPHARGVGDPSQRRGGRPDPPPRRAPDRHQRVPGHRGARTLDLTFKEFELLRYLAQHPGRVCTRPALLRQVWGYDFYGGTRTVDVHVRRLRAKLGPEHEHLIETVRGVGLPRRRAGRLRSEDLAGPCQPEMTRTGSAPAMRAETDTRGKDSAAGVADTVDHDGPHPPPRHREPSPVRNRIAPAIVRDPRTLCDRRRVHVPDRVTQS